LFNKALSHREEHTSVATSFDEFKRVLEENPGFIKAMWCGDVACEEFIKEETSATSRCIPFEQEKLSKTCVCCEKPAEKMVYWAKAY
jgi:prolyl-tRNA synthetase